MTRNLSHETLATLRNCHLAAGCEFVRCVPIRADHSRYDAAGAEQGVAARRIAAEISEDGVFWSYHEDFGDYVRVNRGSEAFRLICEMKS